MNDTFVNNHLDLEAACVAGVNYVRSGIGPPVVLLHGIAASFHDWDELIPDLCRGGFAAYALDLLGHGASDKPKSRTYHIDWLFDHFAGWMDSLDLDKPAILVGHSLGGYLALEFARRYPARTVGLVLSNPLYQLFQLSALVRLSYRRPALGARLAERIPQWLLRFLIDASSVSIGHNNGGIYGLSKKVRDQTTLDYQRTAPGVYNLPSTLADLSPYLPNIETPTLVIWGVRDLTLNPTSFQSLIKVMPHAEGKSIPRAGHVVHQSHSREFNRYVLDFLNTVTRQEVVQK